MKEYRCKGGLILEYISKIAKAKYETHISYRKDSMICESITNITNLQGKLLKFDFEKKNI